MKNVLTTPKAYMLAGLLIIAASAIAWQTKTKKQPRDTTATANENGDTSHPRRHASDEDAVRLNGLDEGLKQLDVQLKNIDINLSGLDTTINNAVKLAINNIDFGAISRETTKALNSIDWKEIQNNINTSMEEANKELKNIDWKEVQNNINTSMQEANRELKKIDWNQVNSEINEATNKINTDEIKGQLNGLGDIINNAMSKASEGLENVRTELKNWKDFTNDLEKDGLINKKKGYRVEWKNDGELYINGTKQTKEVSDKYRKYYKEGGYTINNDGDETEQL